MLGKNSMQSSPKKIIKSSSIDKIYGKLFSSQDYYMVKDSMLKSNQIISTQEQKSSRLIEQKLSSVKSSKSLKQPKILVNPETYAKPNFIERKYPTFFSDQTQS